MAITNKIKKIITGDSFCPVTCPACELKKLIKTLKRSKKNSRALGFFEGIYHCRIVIAAATGGKVGK